MLKELLLLPFFILIMLLSCESTPQNPTSVEETPTTAPSEKKHDYSNIKAALQGTWKRVDYPYGTIVFRGQEVKIEAGEGVVEPATFEPYEIANSCAEDQADRAAAMMEKFYLLQLEGKYCSVIQLEGQTLRLSENKGTYSIVYEKQATSSE